MLNIYFEDYEEMACDVCDKYDSLKSHDEYEDVAIIAKYEEARQIIKELMCLGYNVASVDIADPKCNGYNAEYVITLFDGEIWCDPFNRNGEYLVEESPIIYVLDNCSSMVIPFCKGKIVYEVAVGEEECDCDECQCSCKEENDVATTSTASYTVNGKPVSKAEFERKYADFKNNYLNSVRDMVTNYYEFIDEINEWSKLFRW